VIIFHNLTEEHMLKIVDLQMHEIAERLSEQGVTIVLTDAAREWLAKEGYDRVFGARPLRRTLQRYVENPLALQLLSGERQPGAVIADLEDGKIVFTLAETASPEMRAEKTPAEVGIEEARAE
jgi:ATP-dependent Clp protease ATP-binding subunit ClpA